MSPLVNILIANLLVSLISFSGIFALALDKLKTKTSVGIFVSFAAGTLLASAFLTILREALEEGDIFTILSLSLIGMMSSFFLERFFLWHHHHHENTHNIHPSAILVILGDSIHNFIDGLAIAATFVAAPSIGFTTTLAVATHEIPQEVADFSILKHSGFSTKRALWLNFLSALTAIIGGIIGYYFFNKVEGTLPLALGFTAGIFIYVASADLIPSLHEEYHKGKMWEQVIPFVIGVLFIYVLSVTLIEAH